jgi:hypothetical protein
MFRLRQLCGALRFKLLLNTAAAADQGVSVQQIARTATMATVGDNSASLAKFDLPDRQIGILVQINP